MAVPDQPYPPARAMFWLAFLHLLFLAGVTHRAGQAEVSRVELWVMAVGLLVLWPLIAAETWIAFLIRDRTIRPRRPTLIRSIAITFAPPLRMGMPDPWTGRLWLPRWGWCERGKVLEDRLERTFHKPMLVFAVLILPVLALEFVRADDVRSSPALALTLHASVALIWVAFATEFAIKVSASRKPFVYSRERWIDLAIVVLPLLEFALSSLADAAPVARLLRLTRAVAPEQLARMGQMYRLRGLITKAWRAVLVLRLVAKVTGNTPEKQLRKLEAQIVEAEALLADLRNQAEGLRRQCATGVLGQKPEVNDSRVSQSPGREGDAVGMDQGLDYLPVRRIVEAIEKSISDAIQWVAFEPNTEPTWVRVVQMVAELLMSKWRDGDLIGATPTQAFFVRCDRTTMTQADIDNGVLVCQVGIALIKPAEFEILQFQQMTADAKP